MWRNWVSFPANQWGSRPARVAAPRSSASLRWSSSTQLPRAFIKRRHQVTSRLGPDFGPSSHTMPILASFDRLDALFPAHVAKPPSELSPTAVPGTSDAAAHALASCLKENHINFHCFFNEKRYHNHLAHHLFAAYKLGATPTLIHAAYNEHTSYQRPAFPSPVRYALSRLS